MRCAVIVRHRGEFPVRLMCRVLEVSASGFYAYLQLPVYRYVNDAQLTTRSSVLTGISKAF